MIRNSSIVLAAVCCEFDITPERVLREYDKAHLYPEVRIRRVYWYMCRQFLASMNKKTKLAVQGGYRPIARMLGIAPQSLLRACTEVEDRRDDPEFDEKLSKIEAALTKGVAFSSAA